MWSVKMSLKTIDVDVEPQCNSTPSTGFNTLQGATYVMTPNKLAYITEDDFSIY